MKKVIIWGHYLHTHTHSYIHYAFHKAFKALGYNVFWLGYDADISGFDFSNSLFLTEGQVDSGIPIRSDCKYILHNCEMSKYESIKENCLQIQVYTKDVLKYNFEKVGNFEYYKDKLLYLYWATDLLPNEINFSPKERDSSIYWIGTIGAGQFGNINEINAFTKSCILDGKTFIHKSGVDFSQGQEYISKSYIAPAINGTWQVEKGYIPCRIFKNISYGQFGVTNNESVQELFHNLLVYDQDCSELYTKAKENLLTEDHDKRLSNLMNIVKADHTYINRIETILKFL